MSSWLLRQVESRQIMERFNEYGEGQARNTAMKLVAQLGIAIELVRVDWLYHEVDAEYSGRIDGKLTQRSVSGSEVVEVYIPQS